jgi:hypothetical protein
MGQIMQASFIAGPFFRETRQPVHETQRACILRLAELKICLDLRAAYYRLNLGFRQRSRLWIGLTQSLDDKDQFPI